MDDVAASFCRFLRCTIICLRFWAVIKGDWTSRTGIPSPLLLPPPPPPLLLVVVVVVLLLLLPVPPLMVTSLVKRGRCRGQDRCCCCCRSSCSSRCRMTVARQNENNGSGKKRAPIARLGKEESDPRHTESSKIASNTTRKNNVHSTVAREQRPTTRLCESIRTHWTTGTACCRNGLTVSTTTLLSIV